MTTPRQVPLLVQLAWACLAYHRHHRCGKCLDTGFCPMVEVARARIRAWHWYRYRWGRR